jgi:hypothetical protein
MKAYSVRVGRLKVASKRPDGTNWDALSLPDPYVVVKGQGPDRHTTTARNKLEHVFDEDLRAVVEPGDTLFVRVMDEDVGGNDELISRLSHPVTDVDLKRGYLDLKFGSVEALRLTFDFNVPQVKHRPGIKPL